MKKLFSYLLPAVLVAALLIVVSLAARKQPALSPSSTPLVTPEPEIAEEVSDDAYQWEQLLFISGDGNSYESGGLIALSSTAEPALFFSGQSVRGEAEVMLYRTTESALLGFLTHDQKGQQIKQDPDESDLQLVTTLRHSVDSSREAASKLVLPLEKTGLWFVRAKIGAVEETAFIVRSNIGALVKDADNEYLFWGQDFTTRRSITGGTVTTYNLLNSPRSVAQSSFTAEGISTLPLLAEAHVAVVHAGSDMAVVPINLRYLNSEYQYAPFQPKVKETKFFTFTDRPLYKPGDTIYFKSVLRDDDDARYTIPTGTTATVEIYQGYGEEREVVFTRQVPVSADGTVTGQHTLAASDKTGWYSLTITLPTQASPQRFWYESPEGYRTSTTEFQVEHFRKPEYSLDVTASAAELVAGDTASFTIAGQYFFGQPLSGQVVDYTIRASSFYDYEFQSELRYGSELSDEYRYGWNSDEITQGEATLGGDGTATVELPMSVMSDGKSRVFSVEATLDDGSGNPTFARKNLLVHAGQYGIYRTDETYGSAANTPFSLPVVLVPRHTSPVGGIGLTAAIHREEWVPYQEPDKKYPSYRQEEEDLSGLSATTNNQGQATFTFTPTKVGSYTITVTGKDARGNHIAKEFFIWITDRNQPFYNGDNEGELIVQVDKSRYVPTDTAVVTITSSVTADRDVLLSLERARVNRYQVVHLQGKSGTVEVPLVATDMPNIYAEVSSFSPESLERDSIDIVVSADSKKLVVNITPDKTTYGPGEPVTLNIQTTDQAGNPQSAETAVWAVDKALFELSDLSPGTIFEQFWQGRSNRTQTAHSLEGISASGAEGGGCFAEDTPILMADGSTKHIKDVHVGDSVLTRVSESDASLVPARVEATHSARVPGYLVLNGTIKVTPNHRVWVAGSWKEAGQLVVGDTLTDFEGKTIPITSIEEQSGVYTVYDISIAKQHTYFAGGIYAHNKGGDARIVFKDTAYWNPSVRTDATGRAQVRFTLPDNLTTWRLAAVGATRDTMVGQSANEIVVTKAVIVRPVLPNILREGDTVIVEAMAQNFTDVDQALDASLEFSSGEITSAPRSEVTLKAQSSQTVRWNVAATKVDPKAKLTFSLQSKADGSILDSVTQEIPILAFGFKEKRAETGPGSKDFAVKLAPDADAQKSTVSLALSPSVLGTLPEAMKYLINYPYGCVEQTTSRLVPAIIAKRYPQFFSEALRDKNLNEIIDTGLDRLVQLQGNDGGWSWWSHTTSDPFVTAYVVEYLVQAEQAGVDVPAGMLSRAQSYFEYLGENDANAQPPLSPDDLRVHTVLQTYALSLLGSEKGTTLVADFTNLSPDILSLAVIANVRNGHSDPRTNGLSLLLSKAERRGEGVFWAKGDEKYFGSNDASTALAMRALLASGGNEEVLADAARLLTANRVRDYWSNTFATAQVVQALSEFSRTTQEAGVNYGYVVSVDGKAVGQGVVTSSTQALPTIAIAAADIKSTGSTITVTQTGRGPLYSTLVVDEFRTNRDIQAEEAGLTVQRTYVSEKGEGKSLAVGDTVTVTLTVGGIQSDEYYAVIEDKLPGGLVPINTSFKNEQAEDEVVPYFDSVEREISLDGIAFYPYHLKSGERTYTYKARVVSEGTFIVPPATASLMYTPEVHGRTGAQTLTTTRESVAATPTPTPTLTPAPLSQPTDGKRGQYTTLISAAALVIVALGILAVVRR